MEKQIILTDLECDQIIQQFSEYSSQTIEQKLVLQGRSFALIKGATNVTNTGQLYEVKGVIERVSERAKQRFEAGSLTQGNLASFGLGLSRFGSELNDNGIQQVALDVIQGYYEKEKAQKEAAVEADLEDFELMDELEGSGFVPTSTGSSSLFARVGLSLGLINDPDDPSKVMKYRYDLDEINGAFEKEFRVGMAGKYLELKGLAESGKATPLQKKLLEVFAIYADTEWKYQSLDKLRDQHNDFILKLREAILYTHPGDTKPLFFQEFEKARNNPQAKLDPAFGFILAIARFRFEECHLFSFTESLVDKVLQIAVKDAEKDKKDEGDSGLRFRKDQKEIKSMPEGMKSSMLTTFFKKMRSHRVPIPFTPYYDPHVQNNVPYVNFEIGSPEHPKVKFLRVGTPTIDMNDLRGNLGFNTEKTAVVNPEFMAYLIYKELKGEDYSYFNLQAPWGPEQFRVFALKGLQEDFRGVSQQTMTKVQSERHAVKPKYLDAPLQHFKFFSLTHDTAFYLQKNKKDFPPQTFDEFKRDFLIELVDKPFTESGYFFPPMLESQPNFREQLAEIIDDVKGALYLNKNILSAKEKRDFIEIFYALLILKFMKGPACHAGCKDNIDRGGKVNCIVNRVVQILIGRLDDPELRRIERVISQAPALIVRKGEVEHKRADRLAPALTLLDDKAVQARLTALAPKYNISPQDTIFVQRREGMVFEAPKDAEEKKEEAPTAAAPGPKPEAKGSWFGGWFK